MYQGSVSMYGTSVFFEWGFYALWASKAIFRARTYKFNCITYSVRWWWLLCLDEWNEDRRKPTTGRQSPSLFDKWHMIFYLLYAQSHRRGWTYQGRWLPSCGALGGKPKCSVPCVGLEPTTHRSGVERATNCSTRTSKLSLRVRRHVPLLSHHVHMTKLLCHMDH